MAGHKARAKMRIVIGGLAFIFCLLYGPAFAAIPSAGVISPISGSITPNAPKTFSSSYSDTDGWADLKEAYLLISRSYRALANSTYLYYDQNTNLLYLRNDTNSAWLGGFSPGSNNVIENSYAKLNCASSSVFGAANTLTINWSITFKPAYSGQVYNTFLYVKDDAGNSSGWFVKGVWIINYPPYSRAIRPSSGIGWVDTPLIFSAVYSDQDGWQNIQSANFLVSTLTSGANCLYAYYNQNTNLLYLRNDTNSAWLGGFSPGSNNVIENSYAKLNCASTSVLVAATALRVNWSIVFKPSFKGIKNLYLYVRDDVNADQGWVRQGIFNIQADLTAPTGSVQINGQAKYCKSAGVRLNLSAQDNPGGSGISKMKFSNDNVNWSPPEPYLTSKTWTLVDGEGQNTVYVKFNDLAGNWSAAYSDTIILDTTAPDILINPVISPTNQNIILSYGITDNYSLRNEIAVSGDQSPYINEGSYNVTLTAQDLAGNSSSSQVSFTIDKTPAEIVITSPQDAAVVEDSSIQLQGTVDGEAFSETRSLSAGENILTKTVTDEAGNTSSVSITVYFYLGQSIGPEGGQVRSADSKVKVIIPPGALTQSTQIKVLSIKKETLQDAAPASRALLSAVECKPYGLVFNKPAQIVYTLYQAEVPGTAIELGFYDAAQDKIIATGQASTVPTDGYTVSFSIMHFSTYAALKNLIPQNVPIGGGVKIPLPDLLTGSFSQAIPLTVPPGRKGLQPALALSYRSSNPNSWLGLGFSLNPGYIVRSTRLGPPTYNDTQDTFYLVTDAGTTELVYLIDNLYQAKVESSFTKFFKEADDSWRALGKDGSILRFGESADSKETSQKGTFSWQLTKARDTNGNYIEYRYLKDQGKTYLSRINYTGCEIGVLPANSVEFFLESRSDAASSYISTSKIVTARRLKEIQVKVNYELVWRYLLEYDYSPDTGRSLLKSITQSGSDGKSLPVQSMQYQKAKIEDGR